MQVGEWLEGVDIKRKKLNLAKLKSNKMYLLFYI